MSDPSTFRELIGRVRAGDEQAAADLVRQYEPLIRREVRLRLEDQRLRRVFDSMDVCQSVLASFFVRATVGQYELQDPTQLVRLLVKIAQNKVAAAARHQHRQCRDHRRLAGDAELAGVADSDSTPSEQVAVREVLERFRAGLSDEEKRLADLRAAGASWEEIVGQLGGTAAARRMQLARAVERVAQALGLDDGADE
jgi:RNA polymerase sigma-70 factor (ECF subfamily)